MKTKQFNQVFRKKQFPACTADQLLALRQQEVDFSVAKVTDFASSPSEVKVLGVFNPERLPSTPTCPR